MTEENTSFMLRTTVRAARMADLSAALGHPKLVSATPGETVDDALIELATQRLQQKALADWRLFYDDVSDTVSVVAPLGGPGGVEEMQNKGSLTQRLLFALVVRLVADREGA